MRQNQHRWYRSVPPLALIPALYLVFLVSAFFPLPSAAIEPPTALAAYDTPNDPGGSITLTWELSPNDRIPEIGEEPGVLLLTYGILRSPHPQTGFNEIDIVLPGISEYTDDTADDGVSFYYIVEARGDDRSTALTPVVGPVKASGQVFDTRKTVLLIFMILFGGSVLFLIQRARAGKELYIRPIPGLAAVDEAIGRATEMGRPILFVPGLGVAGDVATLAAFTMLGRIAHKTAEYQTNVRVPCYDPMVMTIAQDVVKSAYLDAGYPDMYKEDDVFFVTQDQFSYVAAVNGLMIREKPATNFYIGKFYAESLILAETGNIAGSIQIAGTDEIIQIPFFVAACDYTLIGEELYAASAYLSREPPLLGTLKGQDWGKAAMMILIVLGVLAATFGWNAFVDFFATQ
ncbi:MAG: hypothetical protein KJ831_17275 [Candidatus Eisenbacteria bacterium]|nr:hypothetical protein [Candidatus Eisenbacteria bacterium]